MTKYTLRPSSQPIARVEEADLDDRAIGLRDYIGVILEHRRLVAAVALAVTLLGLAYALIKPPLYQGNMLIHVVEDRNGEPRMFGQAAPPTEVKSAVAEIEVLRSRQVIEPVVAQLGLDIEARPKYYPLIGAAIAKRNDGLSTPGLAGRGGWCWGSESIRVSAFTVPDALVDVRFLVTAEDGGRYRLTQEGGGIDIGGTVGLPLELQSTSGPVSLRVDALAAQPGAQFLLARHSRLAAIEAIQNALTVTELGKQSGMISVSLTGKDRRYVQRVLAQIGNEYLRLNQSQRSQDAARSLSVLEAQLPQLKRSMENAEATYSAYRNRTGTADFAEETRLRVQRHSAGQERLAELRQKKLELGVRLGDRHPLMAALNRQIAEISAENTALGRQIRQLPNVSQELERLARDVKATTDLYNAVLRNAGELRVVAQERSSSVRLVDAPALPGKPLGSRALIVMLAAAFGLVLGVGSAFARKSLDAVRWKPA